MLKIKDNELTFYSLFVLVLCLFLVSPINCRPYCIFFICFQVLAPYLPRSDPQLSPTIYELVLNDFLNTDAEVRRPITALQHSH